jgi:choline dehydrogenase-like flavoprotein
VQRGVPEHGWTIFVGLAHPESRGRFDLSGPNVTDAPIVHGDTLSHPADVCGAAQLQVYGLQGLRMADASIICRTSRAATRWRRAL